MTRWIAGRPPGGVPEKRRPGAPADLSEIDGTDEAVDIFNGRRFGCRDENARAGDQEKVDGVERRAGPEVQEDMFIGEP